ncbi:MAG: hypothetical protein DRP74_08215 [Candidatus Omnitrophota bacterium]|mgnify:CR=1 FL=1|nr:MAG: hypothetical protein DRP74_08215 [Candidatus Omnitrophota bacterium]
MESAGSRLRKVRQEKGLSLEEVHRKTKIHLKILKAIEEDSLVSLNAVYAKGFLKIYCKFLGVDPKEFISESKEKEEAGDSKEAKESKIEPRRILKPQHPVGPTIKEVKIKLGFLIGRLPLGLKLKKIALTLFIILIALILFRLVNISLSKRQTLEEKKLSAAKVESKEQGSSQIHKIAPSEDIKLYIHAKEDCWIELRADGKLLFRRILKAGNSESWKAKERIEFSLGNAGVIDVEVNGKRMPALGRRGQVVKNIVITKEGLTVK